MGCPQKPLSRRSGFPGALAVAVFLIEIHDLLLLLLHSGLICSSSVLGLDELNLGSELGHSDLILLLLYREGKKYYFKY